MSWQWQNVYMNHRSLGMGWKCLYVSVPATFTWLGAPGHSCHPCIPPCPQEEKTKHPCPVQPSPTHCEFKGHFFRHGATLHPPIPTQEIVARAWEGWGLLNGGEEMDQEKNTETRIKCMFQCPPTVIMEVWSRSGTVVSPGYSDTPPAKQAQTPEFLGGILVWKEPALAQINGSKPSWSVPQRCMHEQAPSQSYHHLKGVWLAFKCKRTQRVPGHNIPSFNKSWEWYKYLPDENWNNYHLESNILHSSLWMPNVLTQTEIKSSPLIEEQVREYSESRKQTNKFSSEISRFHLLQSTLVSERRNVLKA